MKELLSKFSWREKAILMLAAIVLLGLLIHGLIIEPFNQKQLELTEAIEQGNIDLKWMQSAVYQLPGGSTLTQQLDFEGSLANLIDKEVRGQNLSTFLTQMTPISDDEIRVRYKNIDFNRLLNFIARANSQGVKVKDLRIDATDTPGAVDCSLVLEKNS